MITPVTLVGNASLVARTPSSVLSSPAPSMRMPMPSSSGQVARIGFTGLLLRYLCHDLDFGDAVRGDQPRNLDRGPRRKGCLDITILDRDDRRHLRGEVGVKGREVDDIVPARARGLEGISYLLEGALISERQVRFALPHSGDHSR